MTAYTWSKTAANNGTADATINFAEGQAPSSVNDSARALMAAFAKWRDDNGGSLTTAGTSTAYTLTTNQVFSSLAAMSGQSLRVKFNAANGAAPTLNVDSLGAKAIQTLTGTAVGTSTILANTVYDLVYDNSNSAWVLIGAGFIPLGIISGTKMLFQQTAAPTGWTKDTTHNDKALRVVSGTASSGGSTAFTTVFAARTITQGNLPNVTLPNTLAATTTVTINVISTGTPGQAGNNVASSTNGILGGQVTPASPTVISGSVTTGGSGTAMDFAVQYVDCVVATKD